MTTTKMRTHIKQIYEELLIFDPFMFGDLALSLRGLLNMFILLFITINNDCPLIERTSYYYRHISW